MNDCAWCDKPKPTETFTANRYGVMFTVETHTPCKKKWLVEAKRMDTVEYKPKS